MNQETQKVQIFDKASYTTTVREVPFMKGAWVEFYDDVPANYNEQVKKFAKEPGKLGAWIIKQLVADWNLFDGDKKYEISEKAIEQLPPRLARWLIDRANDVLTNTGVEEKKELPNN